ncbi:MAG: transglycosylase domain-containing protein, partial [Acidobacteria bacterium]|nr:transglycosylase domain-containing protein [Acidobacteriota bacterium]
MLLLAFAGVLAAFATCVVVVSYYGAVVTRTMEGRRWNLPTRLYSGAFVLQNGDAVASDDLVRRLTRLRYAEVGSPEEVTAGRYAVAPSRITLHVNDRSGLFGRVAGGLARVEFAGKRVAKIQDARGEPLPWIVLEPEVVGSVFDEKMEDRTLVSLDKVPKTLVDAILATEDRDYFSHGGLSLKRIAGAAVRDLTRKGPMQGGSTLTQQLVKNMFLTHERTFRRKAVEAVMALVLDAKYSKEEILEAYLNEIYLGQRGSISVTGVEEGSRFYFGKPVSNLDLPESALLAGIIASPGRFSPFRSPERALARRALVLKGMLDTKRIGQEAYDAALAAPLSAVSKPAPGLVAPHFVDFVLTQVKETPEALKQDGLAIYTTLDTEMQLAAEAAVRKGLEDLEKRFKRLRTEEGTPPLQAAIIALDPQTGAVRALVGGRDYQVSQFNRVVQARRQPGSLFKPFVFLAALARRDLSPPITPASIFMDTPISVEWGKEDEAWTPRNYDGQFLGPVTARRALEESRNVPTVRLSVSATTPGKNLLEDVIGMAKKSGISSPLRAYPAVALGAFEVSPLEIAGAYCTFANGGVRVKPTALLGVRGPLGTRV